MISRRLHERLPYSLCTDFPVGRSLLFFSGFSLTFALASAEKSASIRSRPRDPACGRARQSRPLQGGTPASEKGCRPGSTEKDLKRQAGFAGVRCAMLAAVRTQPPSFCVCSPAISHTILRFSTSRSILTPISPLVPHKNCDQRAQLVSGARAERGGSRDGREVGRGSERVRNRAAQDPHSRCPLSTWAIDSSNQSRP